MATANFHALQGFSSHLHSLVILHVCAVLVTYLVSVLYVPDLACDTYPS